MSTTLALLLVIRLYDSVGVGPADAAIARRVATDILRPAAIQTAWVECGRAGRPEPGRPPACGAPPLGSTLMVRVVQRPFAADNRDTLGDAYVDTSAGSGWLATIYVEPIRRLAAEARIDVGTLFGRALAHEVGHLLLGSASHARVGLMRAEWSADRLRRDVGRDWQFSAEERTELARNLHRRAAEQDVAAHRWPGNALVPDPKLPPCGLVRLWCDVGQEPLRSSPLGESSEN